MATRRCITTIILRPATKTTGPSGISTPKSQRRSETRHFGSASSWKITAAGLVLLNALGVQRLWLDLHPDPSARKMQNCSRFVSIMETDPLPSP